MIFVPKEESLLFAAGHNSDNWTLRYTFDVKLNYSMNSL